MTQALIHIAVGPVQDFIAAARRTRDLWFGSHLLSEVSKAAAQAIVDAAGSGSMVFPVATPVDFAKAGDPDLRDPLQAAEGPYARTGDDAWRVAIPSPNKLLAIVPLDDAERIVQGAEARARERWHTIATKVRQRREMKDVIDAGSASAWSEQVEDLLEFYAAWCPLADDGDTAFQRARIETAAALEEAKTLRTFGPWKHQPGGARQSSLDGARCGVLDEGAPDSRAGQRYRIASGEVLSAVDLVKRAGAEPEQFVPVTNVALAPWVTYAKGRSSAAWRRFDDAMGAFAQEAGQDRFGFDRASRVPRRDLRAGCWSMGFDAQVLLENRARKTLEEAIGAYSTSTSTRDGRAALAVERAVEALMRQVDRQPIPYVACLVADGDRLGRFLQAMDRQGLGEASAALCKFSTRTLRIVDDNQGLPIYAGGDDVLALVPVERALACAEALRQAYLGTVVPHLPAAVDGTPPSFSIGIGIGHVLDALSDLRALGWQAESLAKGNELPSDEQRNALAVVLQKRGGQRRTWRARWPADDREPGPTPPELIRAAVDRMSVDPRSDQIRPGAHALSTGKLFEIDALLRHLDVETEGLDPTADETANSMLDPLRVLAARAIGRSEGRGGGTRDAKGPSPADVGLHLDSATSFAEARRRVRSWVDLHVIGRLIAEATYEGDR